MSVWLNVLCAARLEALCAPAKVEVLHYEWRGTSPAMQSLNTVQTWDVLSYPFDKAHSHVIWLRGMETKYIEHSCSVRLTNAVLLFALEPVSHPVLQRCPELRFLSEKDDWVQLHLISQSNLLSQLKVYIPGWECMTCFQSTWGNAVHLTKLTPNKSPTRTKWNMFAEQNIENTRWRKSINLILFWWIVHSLLLC